MTEPPALQQIDRTYVLYGRKKLSYFSGCDYFRLSSHPAVLQALRDGVDEFGLNVAASRSTTGNHKLYLELEKSLGDFFNVDAATLVSSGYIANLAVAQALAGQVSHALIDERAHASLMDAADCLSCPVVRFRHRDANHVASILGVIGSQSRPIILTDGMFSHDGSVPPLGGYLESLPADGLLLLDDAHAAGVLGEKGRGTAQYLGLATDRMIQTITLSKAFGVYGGAVLGPSGLRKQIVERSRIFTGNTPMPLPLASAALQSVRILKTNRSLRNRLTANVRYVKEQLWKMRYPAAVTPSPIIALLPRDRDEIDLLNRFLLAQGIYPPLIHYPGGPSTGYFRFALCSEHTREQLDNLLTAFRGFQNRRN